MRPIHNPPRLMGKSLVQRHSQQTNVYSLGLFLGIAVPLALFAPQPLAGGVAEARVALEERKTEPERLLYPTPEVELYRDELFQGTLNWHPAQSLGKQQPDSSDGLQIAQGSSEADQLFQQGIEQYQVSQFREALQSWQAALEIYRDIGDRAGEAATLGNIGNVYQLLGDYSQALDYYEQSLALSREIRNRASEANALGNIGNVYQLLGDYSQALDHYEQSLALQRELGDRAGEALTLGNIGEVYDKLGDYPQALDYYEQSLVLSREIRNRASEANALGNIGNVYQLLGDYSQALDYYEQSLALQRELGDRSGEANTLENLGYVYQLLGDYSQSLNYYEQRLALAHEIGSRRGEGLTLSNIAVVYLSLEEYEKALEVFQRAIAISQEIGDRATEANALSKIGEIQRALGRYDQALEYHQNSLNIFQEIGDLEGISYSLNSLGLSYQNLGAHEQALSMYNESLVLKEELGDLEGQANTLNNIGLIYQSLGEHISALDFYERSLDIFLETSNLLGQSSTLNNIALIHQENLNYELALALYTENVNNFLEIGDQSKQAQTLNNIGLIYEAVGEYDESLVAFQESLTLRRTLGDRLGEGNTLNNIGYLLESQGYVELAIVFFKRAVNIFESIRSFNKNLSQDLQEAQLTTFESTYRHLADLLLQQNRVFEAQRVLDLLKVQELDSFLRGVRSTSDSEQGIETLSPEQQIIARYQALLDRAIEIKKELYELERRETLTPEEQNRQTELQGQRQVIQQEFRRFIYSDDIRALVADLTPDEIDWNVRLASLEELQDNLAQLDNAVLLYPLILEDRLELVLMTPFGPPIHRPVDVTREKLIDQIGAFRFALEDPTVDAKAPAQQLYEWLIQPIEDDLADANAETIIYAPDGPLRYIPLAALYDPGEGLNGESAEDTGEWLIEQFRINHITALSLSDLTTESSGDINILAGALTSAIDVTVGGRPFRFDDLPFAQEEVEGLAQTVRSVTPLLSTDFSRTSIEEQANRHTILHLATHAKFLIGQPEDSFIVFGDGSHVTLNEMKYGWLSLNQVDLVVLSACKTAVGSDLRDANGEEILGFGYLMEQAGARASIASLWAVDDGGTQLLMAEFYDALDRGNLTKVEALQRAQRALINAAEDDSRGGFAWAFENGDIDLNPDDLSHPYYWAPFILIGNGL